MDLLTVLLLSRNALYISSNKFLYSSLGSSLGHSLVSQFLPNFGEDVTVWRFSCNNACLSLPGLQFPASLQNNLNKPITFSTGTRGHLTALIVQNLVPTDPAYSIYYWVQTPHDLACLTMSCSLGWGYMWLVNCFWFHLSHVGYCVFQHSPNSKV